MMIPARMANGGDLACEPMRRTPAAGRERREHRYQSKCDVAEKHEDGASAKV